MFKTEATIEREKKDKENKEKREILIKKSIELENKWWESFERRVEEMKKNGTTPKSGFSFMPFGD